MQCRNKYYMITNQLSNSRMIYSFYLNFSNPNIYFISIAMTINSYTTYQITKINKIIKTMEERDKQQTRSEEKLSKVNSSMIAFRQLIESLRLKNQNINLPQPTISDANPEVLSSNQSRLYNSQHNINITRVQPPSNIPNSHTLSVVSEDQGIKLKPRGYVAGRDVLNLNMNRKPGVIPSSKFSETVSNNKQSARNKNIPQNVTPTIEQIKQQHPAVEQVNQFLNKNNLSNVEQKLNEKQQQVNQKINQQTRINLSKTMASIPTPKINFQQNKLNVKAISARNKIRDIDEKIVLKYCKQTKQLRAHSQANQIFDYFQGLMNAANVAISSTFIKKFKNCIYFGQSFSEDETYEGFLYFYDHKLYYGEFFRNQKNGKGIQILMEDESIYKGNFKQGQKTGKFWVKKPDQIYIGFLEKGLYHGNGRLETKQSVYEGQFENGQKNGFGEEFFPKTGVKLIGNFENGVFSKRSKSSFSHSQIQKGFKFRSTTRKAKGFPRNGDNSSKFIKFSNDQPENGTVKIPQIGNSDYNNGYYVPPFSLQSNHNFTSRKLNYNKEKIRSYLPSMSNGMNHKYLDPMPENCRDYDYSFDVSSRKDTQFASQSYFGQMGQQRNMRREKQIRGFQEFSQISQQQNNHLDTSAFEEPLPIPTFYKK